MNSYNNPATKALAIMTKKAASLNNESGMSTVEYAMGYLLCHD